MLRLTIAALGVSSTATVGTGELEDDDNDLPLLLLGRLFDDDASNCNDVSHGNIDERCFVRRLINRRRASGVPFGCG